MAAAGDSRRAQSPGALRRVCIGGAFGRTLRLEAALATGLLPWVPVDRIELFGQAAPAGCSRLPFTSDPDAEAAAVGRRAGVINMTPVQVFEDRFIEQLRLQPFLLK